MKINLKDLKPEVRIQPLKMIVYGGSGIGKSTFAADAPNPIFADVEEGADTLAVTKYPIKNYSDLFILIQGLIDQEHDYKTLVVDTIDWFEKHVKDHIIKTFNQNHGASATSLGDIGGFGIGYSLLEKEIHNLITALDKLRSLKRMNIILLAHEATEGKTVNDLVNGSYTKVDMKLEKKSIALFSEWAEMILYATRDISIKVEGSKNRGAKGKAEYFGRIMYTNDSGRFRAKNRLGLPEKIELNYSALANEMKAAYSELKRNSNDLFSPEVPTVKDTLIVETNMSTAIN